MEYTNIWQPLLVIFVSFTAGGAIGSFYMFWKLHTENKLLEIDLEMMQEKLQTCVEFCLDKGFNHEKCHKEIEHKPKNN